MDEDCTVMLLFQNSGVYIKAEHMYTMKDVWSKIQAVVRPALLPLRFFTDFIKDLS